MKRYPSSLSIQEDGFHHLLGEINKGSGLPRDSLAQEVAEVAARAMEVYSQVHLALGFRRRSILIAELCQ